MNDLRWDRACTFILAGNAVSLAALLAEASYLARESFATESLIEAIPHQFYRGDTLLHLASAAVRPAAANVLVAAGANVRAANRRGAHAMHYACDARPAYGDAEKAAEQDALIRMLLANGADVDAVDAAGVTPLDRAVRARGAVAVRALLLGGADPIARDRKSGATPLHRAMRASGASGTAGTTDRQIAIARLLLAAGASFSDVDTQGRSVIDSIASVALRRALTDAGIALT